MSRAVVLKSSPQSIEQAAQALIANEVVGMPTETVYGLAGHGLRAEALLKIFQAKERPLFDPLILHISPKMRSELDHMGVTQTSLLPDKLQKEMRLLMDRFWPGPLTLVLPRGSAVPDLATSGLDSVGIRMPRHPLALQLIDAVGAPLAAPSANRFGRISPTCAQHVMDELGDRIPFVLDGGSCDVGVESSVVALTVSGERVLLRPGGVSREQIEQTIGHSLSVMTADEAKSTKVFHSPGLLPSHYAPKTPLHLFDDPSAALPGLRPGMSVALMCLFDDPKLTQNIFEKKGVRVLAAERLSTKNDYAEAAKNLFAILRRLDASGVEVIWAQSVKNTHGLGFAIQDRLKRAAHQ